MTVNVNTKIGDAKIDRAAMTRLYSERLNTKVDTEINGHSSRVIAALKRFKWHPNKIINDEVSNEITQFAKTNQNLTAGELIAFANSTISHSTGVLARSFGKFIQPEQVTRRVAEEIVLQNPIHKNMTLEQGWNGIAEAERVRISQVIRRGIANGDKEDDIIKTVSKTFGITRAQSSGLVITATTSVYAQADHAVYKANAKYVKGWQYISVLDSRTTALCASRDGHVYPVTDSIHLPPAHWHCRSSTLPVIKHWKDLAELESVKKIRDRNVVGLTEKEVGAYDLEALKYFNGEPFQKETYNSWLIRQPQAVQLRHLGNYQKVKMLQNGELTVDKFITPKGASIGLRELNAITGEDGVANSYGGSVPGTSKAFINAKERLDAINLGYVSPDEILGDAKAQDALFEYYKLQSGELSGNLSLTNYRGLLPHVKRSTKNRVLNSPPTEAQLVFNPITRMREDARIYQPNYKVLERSRQLVSDSTLLTDKDKAFISSFTDKIIGVNGVNEAAVISDNLRVSFERFRKNGEPWGNLKAVLNSQMKYDITNISEYIETQLRRNSDMFYKLKQHAFLDPVLGPTELRQLGKDFIKNIVAKNNWEDSVAPKLGRKLRPFLDGNLPVVIWKRLDDSTLTNFYTKFAMRLARADAPDRDQLAVGLGRDLYNAANLRGSKKEWYDLGCDLLDKAQKSGMYTLESFGVKKRRMRSRMSGQYFGQYHDVLSVNVKIIDKDILEYADLTRKIDVGYRVGSVDELGNKLYVRPGYKTYFTSNNYDTRIPVTSTSSFADLDTSLIDQNMADALNWAAQTKYKIDPEFHDFIEKLLWFQDDKGQADYFNNLNHYRQFIAARGDAYERFKAMKWLRDEDLSFGNHTYIDHRGRIYDSGFISPQAGESFRPFFNTPEAKPLGAAGLYNLQDQIGAFLGGLSDKLEGRFNGLSQLGRQSIAEKWRPDMVRIGNKMLRAKPQDIRDILEDSFVQEIDAEEQGKFFRLALEQAKIDNYLKGSYKDLKSLDNYMVNVALEQDASSSGAQIIALTTKNKQLAELSNVVPTNQKQRLYDIVAQLTYDDPRFKELNLRLGLSSKDLRKASKALSMVTFN